uniref:Uncharacterized protein n=1 Tax=Avena sativa TaxID=4498 RepID=A0ACD5TG89_AVESA
MSCGGGRPPPAGFGAAAAGRRPLREDSGGAKSSARASTTVNLKTETEDGSLENKNVSPGKGPYKRPRVNASRTGQDLRPCKKSKGLGKHGKLEDNKGATVLRRPPTPIELFEDECVFCHSFRTSEIHGPMVQYRDGRVVSSDEGNLTNTMYVHTKCMEWAPQVYLDGDNIVNMETEIERAKGLNCSRCRLPGAALECYLKSCRRTYHVPCAVMIPECRWDVENHNVWCPNHASDPLPCSTIIQNQCPANKEIFADCHMEDRQIHPLVTSNSSLPKQVARQCLDEQVMPVILRREDQQVDQLNTWISSFSQGQCLFKEGIYADYRREERQINHSRTPMDQWVLLGSVISASEKDSLKDFASLTRSTLAEEWDKNVTHVIVGRGAGISCGKSYEVLMAILSGKWVVTAGWIVDCLAEPIPGPKTCLAEPIIVPEISYEVEFFDASHPSINGPKKGRAGAAEGAPKLFSGLHFCLSKYMSPEDRENIKGLIAAAEGQVLEAMSQRLLQENVDKNPAKVYFIYVSGPPRDYASTLFALKEIEEVRQYRASGAKVIRHLWLFDAIASYDARMLEQSYREDLGVAFGSC